VVIGGIVGFHLHVLLLSGDDDVVSVPINVDDIAKICHGEVIKVARLLQLLLCYVLPAFGAFGIPEPTMFFLNIVFVFYLHGTMALRSFSGSQ
jgi:hypothetical protein